MIKESILNVYAPTNRVAKYVKQKLIELKGEIDKLIITVVDFNTRLSTGDKTSSHKVSKDTELNNTINQQDLISIYRTIHPATAEYTFFSITKKPTFTKIDHILRITKPQQM